MRREADVHAFNRGYRVTDSGDVVSFTGTTLKLRTNEGGYHIFNIAKDGHQCRVTVRVHVLAAMQWFGVEAVIAPGTVVRHLDGVRTNNRRENLALGTARDNSMDRPKADRLAHGRKAARAKRSLSDEEAREIRRRFRAGASQIGLAKEYNVSKSTVSGIVNGVLYLEVGETIDVRDLARIKADHIQARAERRRLPPKVRAPRVLSDVYAKIGPRPPKADKDGIKGYMNRYMTARYHERKRTTIDRLGGKCNVCGQEDGLSLVPVTDVGRQSKLIGRLGSISESKLQDLLQHHVLACAAHSAIVRETMLL